MSINQKNPYNENDSRLADVIDAIQVIGTYNFYKLYFSGWADRSEGKEARGNYWKTIFIFFSVAIVFSLKVYGE